MQYQEYYQVGGFQAHIKDSYDTKDSLARKARFGRDGLDLVLGIRPSGASYLLVSRARAREIFPDCRPIGRALPAENFISLSPIHFVDTAQLSAKLQTLTSNKKTTRGQAPRDRSKANTSYTTGGDGLSSAGTARAAFEHQRVLTMLLRNTLQEPAEYALYPLPRIRELRLVSLAYNTWVLGKHNDAPVILDIAWTEFATPTPTTIFGARSTVHCIPDESRFHSNPKSKRLDFLYGSTDTITLDAITSRLHEFFGTSRGTEAPPTILLVHNAVKTMKILNTLQINTVHWEQEITDLLWSRPLAKSKCEEPEDWARNRYPQQSYRASYQDSRGMRRSRSRSPKRESDGSKRRPTSPQSRPNNRNVVYVVAVRQLFQTMKQVSSVTDTVFDNARSLGVHDSPNIGLDDKEHLKGGDFEPAGGMCAGHESRLLGQMWYSMACGPAIDEQRTTRAHMPMSKADEGTANGGSDAPAADSDEEVDPNDIVQPAQASTSARAQPSDAPCLDFDAWDDESDDGEY